MKTEVYYLAECNDGSEECSSLEEAISWLSPGFDEYGEAFSYRVSKIIKTTVAAGGEYVDD